MVSGAVGRGGFLKRFRKPRAGRVGCAGVGFVKTVKKATGGVVGWGVAVF